MLLPKHRFTNPTQTLKTLALTQQKRNESIKEIGLRIKSVGNIKKITSAMKMVAQAKQKHDIKRMNQGLTFSEPIARVMAKITVPENGGGKGMIDLVFHFFQF